ncbi:MAG TPA: hypothetical protein VIV57_22150 [Anaeromyxobacter sp.]
MRQQSFELRTWGGKRKGAGRKPAAGREGIRHDAREPVRPAHPVHVTMRMVEHVWNLRSQRSFRIIDAALHGVRARRDFRVVHFSVLGNHVHLIVEADGTRALANGMRALSIRLALRLNAMMGRSGPVFAGRYHSHVLKTPAEVRNAVRYVLGNFASHEARRGKRLSERYVDRFSSACGRGARVAQLSLFEAAATSEARSWLLRRACGHEAALCVSGAGRRRAPRLISGSHALNRNLGGRRNLSSQARTSSPGTGLFDDSRAVAPSQLAQAGRDDLLQELARAMRGVVTIPATATSAESR